MLKGQKKGEKSGVFKKCLICNTEKYVKPYQLAIWKYCSMKCRGVNQRGKVGPRKGIIVSEEAKKKMSESHMGQIAWNKNLKGFLEGDKHYKWQAENPSYRAVHAWVNKMLSQPKRCYFCKSTTALRYEWANISGEYKRDLTDFMRLCRKCHYALDIKGINISARKGVVGLF